MRNVRQAGSLAAMVLGVALPGALWADVNGADPRLTGAPGESNCTACHSGTALNGGGGSVEILLPNGNTYTPGVTQKLQVQVNDPAQRRWGFELSPRVASSPMTLAGTIASVDSNTRVICENGRAAPCSSSTALQYITHTLSGTRIGTTAGVTFEFNWTPPANDVGDIILYAAGNAANGNNSDNGDHIYTTNVRLSPASTQPKPTITSDAGVVNGASFEPGIAQNSWVTIRGTALSSTTRVWGSGDINDGRLPTSLDNVSVTINGKAAYVQYVSPSQINVLAPADDSVGPVEVKVTSNGQTSDSVTATLQAFAPAFFTFDGKYLAATHSDNSYLGKAGLFASAPNLTTPAKAGETIILYGTGFGPTDPTLPAGQLATSIANLSNSFKVTIGGLPASVSFAGLVPPYAALYQFNVQVPTGAQPGDQPVVIEIGGIHSSSNANCCFITVQ